jgi:hypothetical protein
LYIRGMSRRPRTTTCLIALLSLCASCAGGCTSRPKVDPQVLIATAADGTPAERTAALRAQVVALSPAVDPAEADAVARTAVEYTAHLVREYRLVRPRELHNVLVNMRLRPRGLCYQWAEDFYRRIGVLGLKTLDLHWAVAEKGDLWLEHSSIVLTAKGQPFEQGLVLDAWRNEGRLHWAIVSADTHYPWKELRKHTFSDSWQQFARRAGLPETPGLPASGATADPLRGNGEAVNAKARLQPSLSMKRAGGDVAGRTADEGKAGKS